MRKRVAIMKIQCGFPIQYLLLRLLKKFKAAGFRMSWPTLGAWGFVFTVGISSLVAAETQEGEKGLAIILEADRRDSGFGDFTSVLTMILKSRHGEESVRHLRIRSLEGEDGGNKTLIVFDRPGDIKGTALLTFSYKTKQDDQWLYLPALKRVKRISSRNKSGPFMGSEFAYEDISCQEIEKYTYKYLRDEILEGEMCFVIERYPIDPRSGYTRQVVWIDQREYRFRRIDFFDRKKELLKTLTFHQFRQYREQYWRSEEMHMVNHQTGKSTQLIWSNYQFSTGLSERDFDRNNLKRIK